MFKYKLVKTAFLDVPSGEAFAVISKNGLGMYREVVIKQTYREFNLDSLLRSIAKIPTDMWVTSPSVPGKVLEVYAEAWTRKGIAEEVQNKYPEYYI